ncbi:MAG: type II toxin-antitoxin system RelE/ParE family toxin [Betaproteobacteria bacterium]
MYELRHYQSDDGRDPIQSWLDRMRDARAHAAVLRRIDRMAAGNFGDHAFCREGVWELRIDVGPGYRVYYAFHGRAIVLLLCGGDKRKQQMDLDRALSYFQELRKDLQ